MGSLRNPIGPLPSSIYWRRRAVALLLFVLLALLAVWAFSLGGSGGGKHDESKGTGGDGAASTITPGPSATTPVNSNRPGGRDEADDDEDGSGSGGGGGNDGAAGGGSGGGGSGADGAQGIGSGEGVAVPADSLLPDCKPGAVELTVRSVKGGRVKSSYAADEKPTFEIIVKNSASSACKVDFGRASASLTITDSEDDHVWASDDCPKGSAVALIEVPGEGESKRTVVWDRERSAEGCATPSGGAAAGAGEYLVEAKVGGLGAAQVSFTLEKD
ncbi:hypothetical protein [Streptomyces sp. XD-27]|uniref:hypothetical protein n=1 Tax=Streptomyces sp. XD-27 TaxID=3062779 RepID=UPI0026F4390D|nr:hypothetical protein [Streptomyces sp. XD-27]WKX71831.1 hypothetical protein Q3Y56_19730 [Streptomyces sp. XD-27]